MTARLASTEVKSRLQKFAKQFKTADNEQRQAQIFWAGFYNCFGISAAEVTVFEQQVRKLDGNLGRIDSFIPGLLIVEHKSKGRDLDKAYEQAQEYFLALKAEERPKYIITSDFARIVLHDLAANTTHETTLADLPKHSSWFKFLYSDVQTTIVEETPINRNAAYAISKLHEALLRINFKGRDLEIFLTRLLFCLFADDTNIFDDNGQFRSFVESTKSDGSDVGQKLYELYEVLNTDANDRLSTLDDELAAFPYVNGSLFAERTRIPVFNSELRELILTCATLDWSNISPAIFGAMFQGVLEEHNTHEKRQATRRELGAHYTSERNILRVIGPLFLDKLRDEFEASKRSKTRLKTLYDNLPTLKFFDPACGCGNFLVIAYRELRKLENEIIAELFDFEKMRGLFDVSTLCRVNLSQFYGIEIDEAAAHIARVALYITDHQQNLQAAEFFGTTRATIPLIVTPHIHVGNALQTDWATVLSPTDCNYVFGNPPFIGKKEQNTDQKEEVLRIFKSVNGAGVLDYVCCWYAIAVNYIKQGDNIKCAFVSTNSITQGEQVGVLWSYLHSFGVAIDFAHRTFKWSNEGKGNAAVHCVIVGFSLEGNQKQKQLFFYDDISAEPKQLIVGNINPYLVEAPYVAISKRSSPICNVAEMNYGSMPIDNNFFTITAKQKIDFIAENESNEKLIRKYVGGTEFLNNEEKFCLWLKDADLGLISKSKLIKERIESVKDFRAKSERLATNKLADFPMLFGEIRQPKNRFLLLPKVSSENRKFMPIGFMEADVIASGSALLIPNATEYDFGVLQSSMHMAWMRTVCGRMKSDYQYSASIVYNNFIWPPKVNEIVKAEIETAVDEVLRLRTEHGDATLAMLYNTLTMPPDLVKAHKALDRAVDKAYGYKGDDDDASRVAFLFKLYEQQTSLLPSAPAKKAKKK